VTQLVGMWDRRATSSDPAALLHGYLTSWLTVHILGEDQVMARMMDDIHSGMSAADALAREAARSDRRIAPLLDALHKLYHVLSVQNRELAASNQSLEHKVLERTQQLLQSEKMASLGRMVAGFAHELNTPVGIAIGAVSHGESVLLKTERLLSGDEVSADELMACLNEIEEGNTLALANLQRAAELVQRLKRSSIDQEGMGSRVFRFRDVVDDVLLGLKPRLMQAQATVDVDIEAELFIDGKAGLFEQMLTTLVGNALRHGIDAQRGGVISLRAHMHDDRHLRLTCSDNGQGMVPEVAARIFEPFFTTQRSAGRLGLGLYLCYNLITSTMGGQITCTSTPGAGTVFDVMVPVDRAKVEQ
jgi:two-component system, NtrC family, sensor kinase